MVPGHERYEDMAVGHVLGGLSSDEATEFRSHLLGCRTCRARVVELRDIASDLAAAEREERAALRVKTTQEDEADPREMEPLDRGADRKRLIRMLALVAIALAVAGLSLWNAHLRAQNRTLVATTETREQTLATLGDGTVVPTTFGSGVSGVVAVSSERIGYSLSGLPSLQADQRLAVWLYDEGSARRIATVPPTDVIDGRLASVVADRTASRMTVTVEAFPVASAPGDEPIVDADLDAVGARTR